MNAERIHVIINPSSGQDQPVLAVLNRVFRRAGVEWSVSVTQKEGDAQQQTKDALAQDVDVIAVYGGDGTVTAVTDVLVGTDTPLAVLPGGTGNAFAQELRIPTTLEQAAELAVSKRAVVRSIDVGEVNHHNFLLRVGLGFEAQMVADADRALKDQLGFFAYLWSAGQNAIDLPSSTYHICHDGKETIIEAVTCGIVNSGQMGLGLKIAPSVQIDDGLLDIFAVRQADIPAIGQILSSVMGFPLAQGNPSDQAPHYINESSVLHWQAKEISIRTDPPQMAQFDGEVLGRQEVECKILPSALKVIAPA